MDWLVSATLAFGLVAIVFIMAWTFAPKGWRTIVANGLAAAGVMLFPLLDHLMAMPWNTVLDKKTAFFLSLAITSMNLMLRKMTSTPVGEKT